MNLFGRAWYRTGQFIQALVAKPEPIRLKTAQEVLTDKQFDLFQTMQSSEQAHALQVMCKIADTAPGEAPIELLVAALLHDVGKSRYPLSILERVAIVLAKVILPGKAAAWGKGQPRGWKRPFVVARQHPQWGAEMAAKVEAPPLAQRLIQRHQESVNLEPGSDEDRLLQILQAADNES